MDKVSQRLSDALYRVKESISDAEYMELMNLCKELNTEEKKEDERNVWYKITLLYPKFRSTMKVADDDVNWEKEHVLDMYKVELRSRLSACKENLSVPAHLQCCACRFPARHGPDAVCAYKNTILSQVQKSVSLSNELTRCRPEVVLNTLVDERSALCVVRDVVEEQNRIEHFFPTSICHCDDDECGNKLGQETVSIPMNLVVYLFSVTKCE